MKKLLLVLVFLLSSITALAVRFVVDTKDGYANVRNEATKNSDVIGELKNGRVVTSIKEHQKGDWYYIEYEAEGTPFDYGYIHKSQLKKYVETK